MPASKATRMAWPIRTFGTREIDARPHARRRQGLRQARQGCCKTRALVKHVRLQAQELRSEALAPPGGWGDNDDVRARKEAGGRDFGKVKDRSRAVRIGHEKLK